MTDLTRSLPEDWEPDCTNCVWFLAHYERKDLYLFWSFFGGGWHVLNYMEAIEKPHGENCGCSPQTSREDSPGAGLQEPVPAP